jgi:acyl carrier protein
LARLATKGVDVDLTKWDARCSELERPATDAKPAMTVSISGANIMLPRESRPSSKPKKTIINMTDEVKRTPQGAAPVVPQQNKGLLQATQESILALQKMQEQTARLHQQYLEGQETAQESIQSLLEQQQRLMSGLPLAPVTQQAIEQTVQQQIKLKVPVQEKSVAPLAIEKPIIKELEEPRPASSEIAEQTDIDINNLLLSVVSEKTGYPLEMLSLDMSLDTDLGIDSIKRVEILSALQEKLPWSAAVNPEELGTF